MNKGEGRGYKPRPFAVYLNCNVAILFALQSRRPSAYPSLPSRGPS